MVSVGQRVQAVHAPTHISKRTVLSSQGRPWPPNSTGPATLPQPPSTKRAIGLGEPVGGPHNAIFQCRALQVADAVQWAEDLARELACLVEDRVDQVRADLLAAGKFGDPIEESEFVQNEPHVADWSGEVRHFQYLAVSGISLYPLRTVIVDQAG